MSPITRALLAAFLTLLIGGTLNMIAMRRRWISRFGWLAAVVSPIGVGLLVYYTAA